MRVLPPGDYIVRAKVTQGNDLLGEVRRAFTVTPTVRIAAGPAGSITAGSPSTPRFTTRMPVVTVAQFGIEDVLGKPVLGIFLDRVALRPDAALPGVQELMTRARSTGVEGLVVSDAEAAAAPTAAFLKGLSLLANRKLDPAAAAFREAMRGSVDFYPAMIYLGACYAAGGNDRNAAGAWQMSLITEGEAPFIYTLLGDAFLRVGDMSEALDILKEAAGLWPENDQIELRLGTAYARASKPVEAVQALDRYLSRHPEDQDRLFIALRAVYEARSTGQAIETVEEDRKRFERYAA
jgi:predicted Zn-dependent protease